MVHKYYLSFLMKGIMIFILVMMSLPLLVVLLLLLVAGVFHLPIVSVLLIMAIGIGMPVAAAIWRLGTPAVEISEFGFKVSIPLLFKSNSATWNEIEGMTFGNIRTFGIADKQLKILLKSEGPSAKEIILSLKAVEKPDELIAKLRERIPEISHEKILQSKVLQESFSKETVTFGKWTLTKTGMAGPKLTVAWNDVKAISYSGLVIAGYGATTITYAGKAGKEKSLIVQPKTTEAYHDFIRYLVQHSVNASIDPGMVKVLEYSPKDARADTTSTMLFILAVVLLFTLPFLVISYSPGEGTQAIYPLLPVLFGLVPMAMTIKLLAGRFRGNTAPASKKLRWAFLSNAGQVAAVLVFFMLTPFSSSYLLGDIAMKTDNLLGAEYWYGRALEIAPDNIDVTFDMGLMYREKKEYGTAFDYLRKAYEKDPKYFGPLGLELLPDTLMKMGSHDEAVQWCDKILADVPRGRDIKAILKKKRNEILADKAQPGKFTE